MRLLNTETFKLTTFFNRRTRPRYAILSHTWGDDEVSFQDIQNLDTARLLTGFSKIQNSCRIAWEEEYEWIWIDTCCIDKSSSVELTEAINSMYSYYRRASWCIAFLEDVPPRSHFDSRGEHYTLHAFRNSRWFTRGWTLQELIAPSELSFYAQGWTSFGSKEELLEELHDITSIEKSILKDPHTQNVLGVKKKHNKRRRRGLLPHGIFDVNMPLLYGEGGVKAFLRLQEAILKESTDHSLFGWTAIRGAYYEDEEREDGDEYFDLGGMLAHSPLEFAKCSTYVTNNYAFPENTYEMTNLGLHITLPTIPSERTYGIIALINVSCTSDRLYSGVHLQSYMPEKTKFHRVIYERPRSYSIDILGGGLWKARKSGTDTWVEVTMETVYIPRGRELVYSPPALGNGMR